MSPQSDDDRAAIREPVEGHGLVWRALTLTRALTIAFVLLLAVIDPLEGRWGLPTWLLVLFFAGYNLALEAARRRVAWFRSFGRLAVLDLVAAGTVYLLGSLYGGLLFVLVFLAVVSAAATLSRRGTLLYTAAAVAMLIAVEPFLARRPSLAEVVQDLGARAIILTLVAVGTTLLVQRMQLEEAVARSARDEAARLAELERLRGNFVAAVSHDLRTPLTSVRAGLGMLEASAGERLRSDEQRLLTASRRSVERLRLQIDELLAFSQLEAGGLRLEPVPFDLRATIIEAVGVVYPLLDQKGQTLELDVPGPLPIEGDPRQLEQALLNLLANAHQHTPNGTRVVVSGQDTPAGIVLAVKDNGPGIPPHARDLIFERHRRLGSADGGTGLGLTIAKATVELHGGRIWVESEPGQGASFFVSLPHGGDGREGCP